SCAWRFGALRGRWTASMTFEVRLHSWPFAVRSSTFVNNQRAAKPSNDQRSRRMISEAAERSAKLPNDQRSRRTLLFPHERVLVVARRVEVLFDRSRTD